MILLASAGVREDSEIWGERRGKNGHDQKCYGYGVIGLGNIIWKYMGNDTEAVGLKMRDWAGMSVCTINNFAHAVARPTKRHAFDGWHLTAGTNFYQATTLGLVSSCLVHVLLYPGENNSRPPLIEQCFILVSLTNVPFHTNLWRWKMRDWAGMSVRTKNNFAHAVARLTKRHAFHRWHFTDGTDFYRATALGLVSICLVYVSLYPGEHSSRPPLIKQCLLLEKKNRDCHEKTSRLKVNGTKSYSPKNLGLRFCVGRETENFPNWNDGSDFKMTHFINK